MRYPVLFAEGIPRADLPDFVPDGKPEPAGGHIGNLGVGVAVEGANGPRLKTVFHAHHGVAVTENFPNHPRGGFLTLNVFIKHPGLIFMVCCHRPLPHRGV
jgi:hypothetical protein